MSDPPTVNPDPVALGILIKSYGVDYPLFQTLISSIERFNVELLPIWVVVPENDLELFLPHAGACCTILSEQVLGQYLVNHDVSRIRPGYINQEIIKMSFWELGLAENYFAIDSDAVILRPFGASDFLHTNGQPYTVLVEDRDLIVDPEYFRDHWIGREQSLRHIQREIGLTDPRLLTCHGHQVLSSIVWKSFKEKFMQPRGLSYADVLGIEPYEYSWYNFWLQKSEAITIHIREPLVKVIHNREQHEEMVIRGLTLDDYARGYLALVVNSNFGSDAQKISRGEKLAAYVNVQDLVSISLAKFKQMLTRRQPQ